MADEPPAEEEDLPLNNEWTVWTNMRSQAGQSKEGWESSLVQLGNFTTINKFWEYCPRLRRPRGDGRARRHPRHYHVHESH